MRIVYIIILCLVGHISRAGISPKKVFVMEIRSEIDPRMSRYVELALKEAIAQKSDFAVVDMNTFGGAVDDADKIRTSLLQHPTPVYVFINKNAASAGALISIACDSIYMQTGSSIGAATVVNGNDGMAAPDKYQSYMRSMMRSTAETNHRNPRIAESMVDPDVDLDSTIKKKGKVLTFTTTEAINNNFCEAEANSIEAILKRQKITSYQIYKYELSYAEKMIAFFLNPAISGILILIMIGGIWFELQSPGLGFPLIAAIIAAILYFTPYYLNGLAENWEILIFVVGLILLGIELFVIPGFGVVGVAGIVCIFGSLILSMLNNQYFDFEFVSSQNLTYAMGSVMASFVLTVVLIFYGSKKLIESKYFKNISLHNTEIQSLQHSQHHLSVLIHKTGKTITDLRPSGKVLIEDQYYDAYSAGEFIEKNSEIIVTEVFNGTLKVKNA